MRTLLSGICIAIASSLCAQQKCATVEYSHIQKSLDPSLSVKLSQLEDFISRQPLLDAKPDGESIKLIRIPVVVHVLYHNTTQNISDAQVKTQIEALNRD